MSPRRALLEELFRRLDEQYVPCCVQRNYASLFDDTTSDVDLLTLPDRAPDLIACCVAAANATGQRLVQKTRFVNHSLVFWNGTEHFVRIDVDTEKRWRRHHLLTAAEVLHWRRRLSTFDIPDVHHECVIILTQALWQGKLVERYAARLRELDRQIPDKDSLAAIFSDTFGLRENLLAQLDDTNLVLRLAAAVRRRTFLRPARALRSVGYALDDLRRVFFRLKSPPGIVLRSIGVSHADLESLRQKLSTLFPLKKGFGCAGRAKKSALRKALFKGGLAIESWSELKRPVMVIRRPWLEPDRGFAAQLEPDGPSHFMHVGSGAMRSSLHLTGSLAHFICSALADQFRRQPLERKGAFVVLVGLDGSGKTTLARNLAIRVSGEKFFIGMRYFHWLPSLRQAFEFPLPETGNQPRQAECARGIVAVLLSAVRLVKNLLRTRLAFWLWLRPYLHRGHLVLVDRYFYNYRLDPASVKFSGPDSLLAFAEKFFPQPHVVVVLRAPTTTLLRRKQELSEADILRQAAALDALKFGDARVIAADASVPADELARNTLAEILKAIP